MQWSPWACYAVPRVQVGACPLSPLPYDLYQPDACAASLLRPMACSYEKHSLLMAWLKVVGCKVGAWLIGCPQLLKFCLSSIVRRCLQSGASMEPAAASHGLPIGWLPARRRVVRAARRGPHGELCGPGLWGPAWRRLHATAAAFWGRPTPVAAATRWLHPGTSPVWQPWRWIYGRTAWPALWLLSFANALPLLFHEDVQRGKATLRLRSIFYAFVSIGASWTTHDQLGACYTDSLSISCCQS